MNTNHHRPAWTFALAAFVLALATACGTDSPASISDANQGKDSSDTRFQGGPRSVEQQGDLPANHPQDDTPRKGAY